MLGKIILYAVLATLGTVTCSFSVQAATPPPELAGLRQSVLALDSAWSMALKDLQQKKQDGSLLEAERKDYAKFITFLSTRIDDYCQLLLDRGGPRATADLPCPESNAPNDGLDKPAAQSTPEKVAALESSLTESLGAFDEVLLKEEERLAGRSPRQRETGQGYGGSQSNGSGGQNGSGGTKGSGGGSGQAGSGNRDGSQGTGQDQNGTSGQQQGTGEGNGDASRSGQGSQTDGGAGAGEGSGQSTGSGPQGGMTEIESGYDDIVARQLREAAEKETDPELKEKLWEEYRKYKESVR